MAGSSTDDADLFGDDPLNEEEQLECLLAAGFDPDDMEHISLPETPAKPGDMPRTQGENGLAEYLVDKWMRGQMTATDVCTISFWATAAGATGKVNELASPPSATKHHSRHLKTILKMDKHVSQQMTLHLPGKSKHSPDRSLLMTSVLPPHEALYREIREHPEIFDQLAEKRANGELPRMYTQHGIAEASQHTAVPLVLYTDGVPTVKGDSALGFWVYNTLTYRRHLVCALRRSRLCQCSCRGWCTLFQVFAWLRWSFLSLAEGQFPFVRFDNRDWDAQDSWRSSMSGQALGFVGCVIALKGDWAEWSHTFGLTSWSSTRYPCPWCTCDKVGLSRFDRLVPGSFPWRLLSDEDYHEACSQAEVHVLVDEKAHHLINTNLAPDFRKVGSRGMALVCDIPSLGLLQGDRLEPSLGFMDTAQIATKTDFPYEIVFWRRGSETRAVHRNPLFCSELCIGIGSLLVDTLHAIHLGVLKCFISLLIWTLIGDDIFGLGSGHTGYEVAVMTCDRLLVELTAFYVRWTKRGGEKLSQLTQLTVHSIGRRKRPALKSKAAQAKSFFFYLQELVERVHPRMSDGGNWFRACVGMRRVLDLLHTQPLVADGDDVKAFRSSDNSECKQLCADKGYPS